MDTLNIKDHPHILSEDEIDLYLKGNREEIDRLILLSLNRVTCVLLPLCEGHKTCLSGLTSIGGLTCISERAEYVDSLIERQKKRNAAWNKIAQSATIWALLAFLGFISMAVWEAVAHSIQIKLGG